MNDIDADIAAAWTLTQQRMAEAEAAATAAEAARHATEQAATR